MTTPTPIATLLHTLPLADKLQAIAERHFTLLAEAELAFQNNCNSETAQALIAAQLAHLTALANRDAVSGKG